MLVGALERLRGNTEESGAAEWVERIRALLGSEGDVAAALFREIGEVGLEHGNAAEIVKYGKAQFAGEAVDDLD